MTVRGRRYAAALIAFRSTVTYRHLVEQSLARQGDLDRTLGDAFAWFLEYGRKIEREESGSATRPPSPEEIRERESSGDESE